jgi:Putative peptidoglycan binding domain
VGFGYPLGYCYPYYGYYPYGYGYHAEPREVVYQAATTERSTVVEVQRRLARAGYYRGAIDGVTGNGTRGAIRSYERAHGLRVDGEIDQRLLAKMGLA